MYKISELLCFIIGATIYVFVAKPENPIEYIIMGVVLAYCLKFAVGLFKRSFSTNQSSD
ncbi:hypothetical protein [Vibrio sp. F13]|uniref:hypothetical protein n=1 Tax=Vibrio sp. F13 TaxID=2070777 RepID=UPI001485332D|nr:hypothetical protein [Vibrio sp. F13]